MHEGTKTIKINKLQQLTSRFESIRMSKDESFDEFYTKLNDIVNSTFNFTSNVDLMMNSHLLRLLILPRILEIFWEIIIEGQETETMLTLRMWRRMTLSKITILKNQKKK